MSTTAVAFVRADEVIAAEIDHLIAHYPPLAHDHRIIHVQVQAGVVSFSGNVMSPSTTDFLVRRVREMFGVTAVDASQLVDDQQLRLQIAHLLPPGAKVALLRQGQVVLAGELPSGTDIAALLAQVAAVPGVRQVVNGFDG